MNRKIFKWLTTACAAFALLGLMACDKGSENANTSKPNQDTPPTNPPAAEEPSEEEILDPVVADVKDVTADITDRPVAFPIGEYALTEVKMNGELFQKDGYLVRQGYFLFSCERYGAAFAVGEYQFTLALQGYDGNQSFTLKIVDEKPAKYQMPLEDIPYNVTAGSVELPLVVRDNPYQTYETSYAISTIDGDVLTAGANCERVGGDSLDTSVLEIGKTYVYSISVSFGEEELEQKNYEFSVYESKDLLSKDGYSAFSYDASTLDVSYDEQTDAVSLYKKKNEKGIGSRFALPFSVIQEKLDAGYDKLEFWYYTKTSQRLDGQCYDHIQGATFISTAGSSFITEYYTKAGVWTKKTINLYAFSHTDKTQWFSFLIFNDMDTEVLFKDMYFSKFDVSNPVSEENVSLWSGVQTTVSYDQAEDAMKLIRTESNDTNDKQGVETRLTSKNNTVYYPKVFLDKAKANAPSAYAIKISYKGSQEFVSSSVPAFKVWASTVWNGTLTGGQTISYVQSEWQHTYIALSDLDAANPDWQYLVFALGGIKDSVMYFKIQFVDEQAYAAVQAEKLKTPTSEENVSLWNGIYTTVAYDATQQAIKLTRTLSNDDDGRGADVRLTSNSHKVYFAKTNIDTVKKADTSVYAIKISYKGDQAFVGSSVPAFKVWAETVWNAGMSKAASATAYATTEWKDLYIPLADLDRVNPDWRYLVLGLGGAAGSSLYLKVSYVGESAYNEYVSGAWAKMLLSVNGLSSWSVYNTDVIKLSGTENSLSVKVSGTNGLTGRYYAATFEVDMLKKLYQAGYKKFAFSVAFDGVVGTDVGLRIYDHKNASGKCDGQIKKDDTNSKITATQDVLIAQTNVAQTVEVDIATFLASGYPRIGIVFSAGANGTNATGTFTLSNLTFLK